MYDHQAFIQEFSPGGVNLTQWSHDTGEAQRAERGGEVLGEGVTSSPPHQIGCLRKRCKQIAGHKPAGSVPAKKTVLIANHKQVYTTRPGIGEIFTVDRMQTPAASVRKKNEH